MEFGDLTTLVSLAIAVFVFWRLRSVLGQRTGHQGPPPGVESRDREAASDMDVSNDNVVTLPERNRKGAQAAADKARTAMLANHAEPGSDLYKSLEQIIKADSGFNPDEFLGGAKMAYEMIVTAFADGDTKTLKNLLSREVYDGFAGAISDRKSRDEIMNFSFVGIEEASLVDAELAKHEELVTVRFVSQIISATTDANGEVVDGDPEQISDVTDIWTFSRDSRSRDPNWKLVATESES